MFRSLRARMAVAGVMAGLLLPATVATPAFAATKFRADTTNGAAHASLYYQYDNCDRNGYCHIKITDIHVADYRYDDGWGAVLTMHRKTPPGTPSVNEVDLASARDNGTGSAPTFERNKHKDVWFEVCNWKPSTHERYSCARLRKSA